jgi:adenosylcobinamide-GDP ribazoletransferase
MLRGSLILAISVRTDCPWWAPPFLAIQFLTRLPVPSTAGLSAEAVATGLVRAVVWFPLVGALVGVITAGIAVAANAVWPAYVAVPIALAIEALVTGAFHEDAVADFCDGFGGGQSATDIHRIMKDSRIGSYGSVGLLLALGLRAALMIAALSAMPPIMAAAVMIASATFGRLLVLVMMALVAPAPGAPGLAKDIAAGVGAGTLAGALIAAAPGLAPLAALHPAALLGAVAAALIFVLWFRRLLIRRLGGSTGDCLGFAAYVGQLILLMAATIG